MGKEFIPLALYGHLFGAFFIEIKNIRTYSFIFHLVTTSYILWNDCHAKVNCALCAPCNNSLILNGNK